MLTSEHKKFLIVLFLIIAVLAVGTYFFVDKKKKIINDQAREIFVGLDDKPALYMDLNGNEISLEEHLGKILVVTSWASWSPFSKNELETLDVIAKDYDSSEVVFLAINRKETRDRAQRYVNTVAEVTNVNIILDPEDRFYKLIEGYAMPETIIYDKKGEIKSHIRGSFKEEDIRRNIDNALVNS